MTDHPQFSIIVPVYNTVKELERCVNSILNQTYDNYELILVDDGSTDGSGALCDSLQSRDSHIRVIHKENSGCSEARNTGVRSAAGDYLLFVDSDDAWNENCALFGISELLRVSPKTDVVCFGVEIYDENGRLVKTRTAGLPEGTSGKKDKFRHLVYTNQYFSTSYVKVLKREFFLNNNLFFVKGLLSEDIEWSARIMILCKDILVYPKAFYSRIQRSEGSITSAIGKKNITDILGSIEKGIDFVKANAENTEMADIYYEYWAYQYAMLLGLAQILTKDPEFKEILQRLKALKWLLKYDHVRKVHLVNILVHTLGMKNAMKVLSAYYKSK